MRVTRVLSFAWLAEVAVDRGIVDVDALAGELAVDEGEDRPGVDLDLSAVVEAPDAGHLEDDHVAVFLQISGWASDLTLPSRVVICASMASRPVIVGALAKVNEMLSAQ